MITARCAPGSLLVYRPPRKKTASLALMGSPIVDDRDVPMVSDAGRHGDRFLVLAQVTSRNHVSWVMLLGPLGVVGWTCLFQNLFVLSGFPETT